MITGVTGQMERILPNCLFEKVTLFMASNVVRRVSTRRALTICSTDKRSPGVPFHLHYGDLTDSMGLVRLDPIHLSRRRSTISAVQSHVMVSFETPEYTANADGTRGAGGFWMLLRILGIEKRVGFDRANPLRTVRLDASACRADDDAASSSKPLAAVAKLYAYWIVVNYREAYGIHASNGILFLTTRVHCAGDFVTRKITRAVASIMRGDQKELLGQFLDARVVTGATPRTTSKACG